METYVERGMEIIERIICSGGVNCLPDSTILKNIVQCHHEFLDGSGYPRGLKGFKVPIEAQFEQIQHIQSSAIDPYND